MWLVIYVHIVLANSSCGVEVSRSGAWSVVPPPAAASPPGAASEAPRGAVTEEVAGWVITVAVVVAMALAMRAKCRTRFHISQNARRSVCTKSEELASCRMTIC